MIDHHDEALSCVARESFHAALIGHLDVLQRGAHARQVSEMLFPVSTQNRKHDFSLGLAHDVRSK